MVERFFEQLWADYVSVAPQAATIRRAFEDLGEHVVNDHVAFRTLDLEPIGMEQLEPHILALGYRRYQPYEFPVKKLRAYGYVPPSADLPRIFFSELKVDELSPRAGDILRQCVEQVDVRRLASRDVFWAGRLWNPIRWEHYQLLQAESEYAAWVACLGIRANHFTISVNHLSFHDQIEEVLDVVEKLGFTINEVGGRIKGSPEVLLEQGSTMADQIEVEFADHVVRRVPTCYYEFAKRYPAADGQLFQGFVAASADKIFESTDVTNPPERE